MLNNPSLQPKCKPCSSSYSTPVNHLTALHSSWVKCLISIYNYLQLDSCQSAVYCKWNLCELVCVDSPPRLRGAEAAPPAPGCETLSQGSAAPASSLLADKKRNHFTFDYLFMSASFIYLFWSCVPFHAAVVLYVGDPQTAPAAGVRALQLIRRQSPAHSMHLTCNCNLGQSVIASSPPSFLPPPLLCSSRLGEITLIVVKCDGNGKSLKGSPALPQHKELNLDRNEDSSADNTNYMCGGAGNGHARCSASFTHAAVLVCWLYLMSNAFSSPQRLRQHCATADLASAKPPECPDCWLGCQRELPGITRSVRLAFELTQRDPGKMVWSSTQTPHHRWSACITVWPPSRVSAVQLDVG